MSAEDGQGETIDNCNFPKGNSKSNTKANVRANVKSNHKIRVKRNFEHIHERENVDSLSNFYALSSNKRSKFVTTPSEETHKNTFSTEINFESNHTNKRKRDIDVYEISKKKNKIITDTQEDYNLGYALSNNVTFFSSNGVNQQVGCDHLARNAYLPESESTQLSANISTELAIIPFEGFDHSVKSPDETCDKDFLQNSKNMKDILRFLSKKDIFYKNLINRKLKSNKPFLIRCDQLSLLLSRYKCDQENVIGSSSESGSRGGMRNGHDHCSGILHDDNFPEPVEFNCESSDSLLANSATAVQHDDSISLLDYNNVQCEKENLSFPFNSAISMDANFGQSHRNDVINMGISSNNHSNSGNYIPEMSNVQDCYAISNPHAIISPNVDDHGHVPCSETGSNFFHENTDREVGKWGKWDTFPRVDLNRNCSNMRSGITSFNDEESFAFLRSNDDALNFGRVSNVNTQNGVNVEKDMNDIYK
ncbi:conserved Plasmodium protein, unknown function [Plasmodium ovale]|uniref:Uncharacterized protein n=2 Tax=Plasmodium ovale TaxID=36330 RepID=A0A1A8WXQ1_PLAOA|nr:hypothetical protein POVCU2_0033830 [Plasmodium ovale curtisi]SBS96152.1 hypothetical protein POVCU1_031000 [Plasmodium ovale curtisi]SCP05329.1 conserved Plasmodium protein, unknown function [Plasmodium ovale]